MTGQASGPTATVQRYVDAFNSGDEDAMSACFVNSGFILDGMAPHVWSGSSATRHWYSDAMVESEHLGISDFRMTLGTPHHENATNDAAYVVAPATLSFRLKGQPIVQSGALFTVALRKVEGHWRIAGWAWSKGPSGGIGDAHRSAA